MGRISSGIPEGSEEGLRTWSVSFSRGGEARSSLVFRSSFLSFPLSSVNLDVSTVLLSIVGLLPYALLLSCYLDPVLPSSFTFRNCL